jgi:hypothetical protein
VLQGYCLVLLDCDVSALGLLYLAALAWVLSAQPRRGKWQQRQGGSFPAGGRTLLQRLVLGVPGDAPRADRLRQALALVESPARQWLPLFVLALLAGADFAGQMVLPVLALIDRPFHIPEGVLAFFQDAVGWSYTARGMDLALRLLRPAVLLACVALYRWLYCLGSMHRELQRGAGHGSDTERQR